MARTRRRGTKNFTKQWGLTRGDFEIICELEDHTDEILERINTAIIRALFRMGMQAESFAKKNITLQNAVDTGRLRNSITFDINEEENMTYVGTAVEYGTYVELGTGKYYPGGRPTPWVYKDAKGNWHMTHGQRARPFLKPAATNHKQTYKNILEDEMKNG